MELLWVRRILMRRWAAAHSDAREPTPRRKDTRRRHLDSFCVVWAPALDYKRCRPPAPLSGALYPSFDLLDRLPLDAVVAVIGIGFAVVAGRLAAIHLDQFGAIAAVGGGAVGRPGGGAGVLLMADHQVPALQPARIEAYDAVHPRR